MKFVAIIDGKKPDGERVITLTLDHNEPIPPVIAPDEPDEPKDTEPPKAS